MSNERKHAALIKRWAENKDLKVEFKSFSGGWIPTCNPAWLDGWEYRIVESDPYQHLKDAAKEGKVIQFFHNSKWRDFGSQAGIGWSEPVECYRIKPEPKYVPFDISDAPDLVGKTVKFINKDFWRIITMVNGHTAFPIYFDRDSQINFRTLFDLYEFVDGTPCGKLVEDENS